MKEKFPWGRVIQIHAIGPYEIVEYAERGADNHPTHPRVETGQIMFHVNTTHLPDSWTGESFDSMDRALIGCIDKARNGSTRATPYAARVLGLGDMA
jgi:hypothetical protein